GRSALDAELCRDAAPNHKAALITGYWAPFGLPIQVRPMPRTSSRRRWIVIVAVGALMVLLAWVVSLLRGPAVPGYEVATGPLVQQVVGTGRVVAPSRVEVGAEIAGLVLERRVTDGDRVEPGDVLVVLRATDLEERRGEAPYATDAVS